MRPAGCGVGAQVCLLEYHAMVLQPSAMTQAGSLHDHLIKLRRGAFTDDHAAAKTVRGRPRAELKRCKKVKRMG